MQSPKLGSEGGADAGLASPRTDSTGARTPTGRRQARHPWTLFVRLPAPAGEHELREFFADAKGGVSRAPAVFLFFVFAR